MCSKRSVCPIIFVNARNTIALPQLHQYKGANVVSLALRKYDIQCSRHVYLLLTQQECFGTMLSLFSGLSNCTVNISSQNFVVNVNPLVQLMHHSMVF